MNKEHTGVTFFEERAAISMGPGARLRLARENMKLSLQDVARQLRLNPQVLQDIEEDNYSNRLEFVFVRGYLRSFAKIVNLPGDEIVAVFNSLNLPDKSQEKPKIVATKPELNWREYQSYLLPYGIGFGLLLAIVIWWANQDDAPIKPTTNVAITSTVKKLPAPVKEDAKSDVVTNQQTHLFDVQKKLVDKEPTASDKNL